MFPYTIVSHKCTRVLIKKKQLESWQKQLEKTADVKAGVYIVSMDRKTTVYGLEAGKIACFEKRVQAVLSNAFPYFTGLPVSSSLYLRYSSRAGVMGKWGPLKMRTPGPHLPGKIETWVLIFPGEWGPGVPISPERWGPHWKNGDPLCGRPFSGN